MDKNENNTTRNNWNFDFYVTQMTREQADLLLEIIMLFVEATGADMTGGLVEGDDVQEESRTV